MAKLLRASLLIAAVLAVPIVPFLLFGGRFEEAVEGWFSPPPSESTVFLIVAAVLATDVFFPVPSSLVSTVAGMQLSIPLATMASWLGLSLGACLGFAVARALGRPLAVRLAGADDLARIDRLAARHGPRLLVLFRALPVLAEASVLLFGATRLSWMSFFVPVALANLGIAIAYSVLGHYGRTQHVMVYVLAASIALPLMATTMVRWRTAATSDD
jgi:uncharacterized membrane protein YdjX (TVP38/TMEM64 family)